MNDKIFGVATKGFIVKDNKILVIFKTADEAAETLDPTLRRDQPGGRLEFGESCVESLAREIREETSLKVKILFPIQTWYYVKDSFQLVGINYLCEWISGEVQLGLEHCDYHWYSVDDIKNQDWFDKQNYLDAIEIFKSYKEKEQKK